MIYLFSYLIYLHVYVYLIDYNKKNTIGIIIL